MNDWFRSWHGAPTDNKWLVIARKAGVVPGVVAAVVWALLDYASQNADRGSTAEFDVETYAAFSGFDEGQIAAVIDALKDKGVIGPDGGFRNWQKRQPKREDGSAERAKAWRERQQTQNERARTQANAGERQIREDTDTDTSPDGEDADASGQPDNLVLLDAIRDLSEEGIPILESMGIRTRDARTMIGKWRQQTGDDCAAVLKAIVRARDQRATDPIPFITASLNPRTSHDHHPHKSDLARAFERFDERLASLGGS